MSKKKKYNGKQAQKRPETFKSFSKCVSTLKKSVYLVARGRKNTPNNTELIKWFTLGSGFIAAPNRFITAAHVINDPEKNDIFQHKNGDKYYLLKHDTENKGHVSILDLHIDKNLFIYPEIDIAIIYLSDSFYKSDKEFFIDKKEFIRISKDFLPIGSEIGVLGYPLCKLEFENRDLKKPKIGNILLRTDKGVINCKYKTPNNLLCYEFTLSFNPGNSGGPIFDIKTGQLISIVKGYKFKRINLKENIITEKQAGKFKEYKEKSFIETINAIYSLGIATPTFLDVFKKHNIIN